MPRLTGEDIERFFEVVKRDSATEIVLRGHLWGEAAIMELVEQSMEEPSAFSKHLDRLGFPAKLALADALTGVAWQQPFLKLNSLRNMLAHQLRREIGLAEARDLLGSFPPDYGVFDPPPEPAYVPGPRIKRSDDSGDIVAACVTALLHYAAQMASDAHDRRQAMLRERIELLRRLAQKAEEEGIDLDEDARE
jgi:hypothetical protein